MVRIRRPPRFERLLRRLVAEGLFFVLALRSLIGPAVRAAAVGGIGTVILHYLGSVQNADPPDWRVAMYFSFRLLMGETPDELPDHPLAELVLYVQPILGILLMAEGLIKLGFEVFNKEVKAEEWMGTLASTSRGHVVVCGLGTVGFRTLEELISLGEQVFVVERKADCAFLEQARELGAHVVVGDARTDNLMRSLNVQNARAVLIVTDDDLANLEIAMDVREMAPDVPIVMRLYDQRLANKVKQTLDVQVSVSTSKLAAPLLASAALDPAVVGTHRIGQTLLVVLDLQLHARSVLASKTVEELTKVASVTVVAIQHVGAPWILQPLPGEHLLPGDRVQLMLPSDRVEEIHAMNEGH